MSTSTSRLLAQLAHDVRSPLGIVDSALAGLSGEDPLTGEERARMLDLGQRAVARLLALTDRLALASRLEVPSPLVLAPVDLAQLTRDTLAQFLPSQRRRRLEVLTSVPAGPVPVFVEAPLVRLALLELLGNATRFGHRVVSVTLALGAQAVVTVEDDGPGVPDDERALLFTPFADRRGRTGLGMGLWLAQRVAELHGGRLVVEALTPGTRQRLSLPVRS